MNRRDVLKLGTAIGLAGGLGVTGPTGAAAQAPNDPKAGGWQWHVDIPGAPGASANIRAVEIEPLRVDAAAQGRDRAGNRIYAPGAVHWGQAKFTSACTLGGSKELQAWWAEAATGKNIRKNVTVTLFKSDKSAGRSYLLQDCFPTQWTSVNFDTSSTVQTETLTCKVGYIEFKV